MIVSCILAYPGSSNRSRGLEIMISAKESGRSGGRRIRGRKQDARHKTSIEQVEEWSEHSEAR